MSSATVFSPLIEASDTFPYLHFLDKLISPQATKSNLVERHEESDDENDDSLMDTSSTSSYSTVKDTEGKSTSPKAGSSKDHVSDSSASKPKQPKELSTRKSKQTTMKVVVELEVIKAVGEHLRPCVAACSSNRKQQKKKKMKIIYLAFLLPRN